MKTNRESTIQKISLAGFLCVSIALVIFAAWVNAFNSSASQEERVVIYKSYFPGFLQGQWDITVLSIFLCVAAIALSIFGLKAESAMWKTINYFVLVISLLLLGLNIFSIL